MKLKFTLYSSVSWSLHSNWLPSWYFTQPLHTSSNISISLSFKLLDPSHTLLFRHNNNNPFVTEPRRWNLCFAVSLPFVMIKCVEMGFGRLIILLFLSGVPFLLLSVWNAWGFGMSIVVLLPTYYWNLHCHSWLFTVALFQKYRRYIVSISSNTLHTISFDIDMSELAHKMFADIVNPILAAIQFVNLKRAKGVSV